MSAYVRLLDQVQRIKALEKEATVRRDFDRADRLKIARLEAQASYGSNFDMADQWGRLARIK